MIVYSIYVKVLRACVIVPIRQNDKHRLKQSKKSQNIVFLSLIVSEWMDLPNTLLIVGYKWVIVFFYSFMNREDSPNNDISWGCSSRHPDILFSGMSSFQNNKEMYDVQIEARSNPGHAAVFSAVPLCLFSKLSFPLSSPLCASSPQAEWYSPF